MIAWDPNAKRVDVGESQAPFTGPNNPKGLLHTTEGFTLDSAVAAYRHGGFCPHVTIGPDPSGADRVVRWQHLPYTSRATTLQDTSGGVRTNRLYVWQVEIVGTCDDAWKTRQGGKYAEWHVDNWPDWYRDGVSALMADWERWFGIPRRAVSSWRPYPSSYGLHAAQRLSGAEFEAYSGWLGHEHASENVHGDPGDLDVADLFDRMEGNDDMPLTKADAALVAEAVWLRSCAPGKTTRAIGGYREGFESAAVNFLMAADAKHNRLWTYTGVQLAQVQKILGDLAAVLDDPAKRAALAADIAARVDGLRVMIDHVAAAGVEAIDHEPTADEAVDAKGGAAA